MKSIRYTLSFLLVLFAASSFLAAQGEHEPVISADARPAEGTVLIRIQLAPDTHITDRKHGFFNVTLAANDYADIAAVRFPQGKLFDDEWVYSGQVELKVTLVLKKALDRPLPLDFKVSYQICLEKPAALCYAPSSHEARVIIDRSFTGKGKARSLAGRIQETFAGDPGQRMLKVILLLLLLGFATSLTPCVYPIIPIVMATVGGRSQGSKRRGFTISLAFVGGLSLVYSGLGVVAALTGSMLGASFQNPWVIGGVSGIFILMGLSMAGVFTLTPPASLMSRLGSGHRGGYFSAWIIGGVSALIAAPCAGPVIIALLSWIAQTRRALLGFLFMLAFSLGMSVIFILAGTFSGLVSSLPRGGKWMEAIKYVFAALLVGAGVFFLGMISPLWLKQILWGICLLGLSVFCGLFNPMTDHDGKSKIWKTLVLIVALLGALWFWRGVETRFFPRASTASSPSPHAQLPWEKNLAAAMARAKGEGKRVMIDTYADWCVACQELEEKTYSRAEVARELEAFILVKLDFTDNKSEANRQLAKRFRIIGNPTVIFLDSDGREIFRFAGFVSAPEFLSILDQLPKK